MKDVPSKASIVVIGASGHLATTKIFPALFSLFCKDLLPDDFHIFGFARTAFSHDEFRRSIEAKLTCRYAPSETCGDSMNAFLARCWYVQGNYGAVDSYLDLYQLMQEKEATATNHLFYLAIPPSIFLDVARAIGGAGFVACGGSDPWSRVVLEKPFGKDRESSDRLGQSLGKVFVEDQIYRIDHYLGKEVIQNLLVLRFANIVFEPIWNCQFIERVEICWKETSGVEGRGGYFDEYGIIRDVMQNHLMQILALIAMEPPHELTADHIMLRKAEVLRTIAPLSMRELVLGQYAAASSGEHQRPGYTEDETVPDDSRTETYAAARVMIDNDRWRGVPFTVTAGKGLDAQMTEIRIHFRDVPHSVFASSSVSPQHNELVIRVQPDESIFLRIVNKVPGTTMTVESTKLDLDYADAFDEIIPDAYESLLLDVLRGDRTLFIRRAELEAAWDVFSPVLHEMADITQPPAQYPIGSNGPPTEALRISIPPDEPTTHPTREAP